MTNHIRFYGKLHTDRVTGLPPGVNQLRLRHTARDANGKAWPKGTVLVAMCGGYDNPANSHYVDALIVSEGEVQT